MTSACSRNAAISRSRAEVVQICIDAPWRAAHASRGSRPIKRIVLHRALHLFSLFCCLIVAASFVLFAHDQVAGASRHQTD